MNRCTICQLPKEILEEVNRRLKDGDSDLGIAKDLELSRDAVRRHRIKEHHLRPEDKAQQALRAVIQEPPAPEGRDVTMQEAVQAILNKLDYFDIAWQQYAEHGAVKSAVEVHKEIRQTLQLLYNLKGWLKTDSTVVQVQINAQLNQTAQKLYRAVEGCPRCMNRLKDVLEEERDLEQS